KYSDSPLLVNPSLFSLPEVSAAPRSALRSGLWRARSIDMPTALSTDFHRFILLPWTARAARAAQHAVWFMRVGKNPGSSSVCAPCKTAARAAVSTFRRHLCGVSAGRGHLHARKASRAQLQHVFRPWREAHFAVSGLVAIHLHGPLLDLAVGFGVARRQTRLLEGCREPDAACFRTGEELQRQVGGLRLLREARNEVLPGALCCSAIVEARDDL